MSEDKNEYLNVDALGTAKFFIHTGKKHEANQILDMVLPYCKTMDQYDAIAYVYTKNRNFTRGLDIAKKMLPMAKNPEQMYNLRTNLARAYLNLNKPDQAIKYINTNKVINPDDQTNLMDEAYSLFLLNRKDEGEKILRKIVENPQSQDIYDRCIFNLGSYDLRNGNFKDGIRNFLLGGRKMEIWKSLNIPCKEWDGSVIHNATILAVAEGGIGDEIINIRFQKHIKDLGMNPVWYTDRKDLAEVFRRNGFNVVTDVNEIQSDWYWYYSMLSPCYLDIDEDDLWYGRYLRANNKPKPSNKIKIGLKISGNPDYDQDLARSIPLDKILEIIPEEYEVYSFHKDEILDHPRVINWMSDGTTWDDTLNKIEEMDFIISSCTSLVHAASAMQKQTFVFVPILKYYLWSNDKIKSPWYSDNTVVLHQIKQDDWNEPIEQLKNILSYE